MGHADWYKRGSWSANCDVCGFKFHSDELLLRWDGARVCEKDFEVRQPQDFVRGVPDPQAPPWTRPNTNQFTAVCSLLGSFSTPGVGTAGCLVVGRDYSTYGYTPETIAQFSEG
jgi:hypothetical protein